MAVAVAAAALMEMDVLVEAFLLRLPPDDPASLVRASLVCKLWRRILTDRGFRLRFCELHRRPPMLGFFAGTVSRFTPTSSFRPRNADFQGCYAIDSRHGRVLLASSLLFFQNLHDTDLAVWDPILGDRLELPKLPVPHHLHRAQYTWNAAVLCASNQSTACDSTKCHHGRHFLVVSIVASPDRVYAFAYCSQADTWSQTTSAAQDPLDAKFLIPWERSALATNALYFKCNTMLSRGGILKYDIGMQEISWVILPSNYSAREILLTTTEYGGLLGIARVASSRLHLWSREAGPGGHLRWAPSRVVELNTVLPANTELIHVVAFLHGLGAFLVSTNNGMFTVDLDSNQARKVCEDSCDINAVPYVSCTPAPDVARMNTGEGPSASVPSS